MNTLHSVQKTGNNPGATPGDWFNYEHEMGLGKDLLPVVSNQNLSISESSSIKSIGKVPSTVNSKGKVTGISMWTKHDTTPEEIERWSKNPDLGICIQTRTVRAIDVDISDPIQADRAKAVIEKHISGLPCRGRRNSSKFLVAFRMPGDYSKRRFSTNGKGNAIEFLATGQQFIASGTHSSGVRYEWSEPLVDFPYVDSDKFESLWRELKEIFSVSDETRLVNKPRRVGADLCISDPVVDHLREYGLAISTKLDGAIVIECPWEHEHTGGNIGDSSTVWLPAGTNGHPVGHFKCLHSHCADRSRSDYLQAIGYVDSNVDVFETINGPVSIDAKIDHTDTGNVNLLARITDGNLRYVRETRIWLSWNGHGWIEDPSGTLALECTRKVAAYYFEAATEIRTGLSKPGMDESASRGIKKTADSLDSWAKQCRNKNRIDSMLDLAKRDRRFEIAYDQLNRDPYLLGVANGVVDLRTGKLRDASREEFVTRRSPYVYKADAEAPRWTRFIDEITGTPDRNKVGDYIRRPKLAAYIQKALGYSITGLTGEQKMFICHGSGANGKNVILDTVARLFPDHVLTINPEILMASKFDTDGERATPMARQLAGIRMTICSESRNTQKLDVTVIKKHTGGGYMSARALHQAPISFPITHKLWLMTNHIPSLDHVDDAVLGRLHLIPFDRKWNRPGAPERDETLPDGDKNLQHELKSESEGILAWLIAGAVRYLEQGLEPPEPVTQTTINYLQQEDGFNAWLNGMEQVSDPLLGITATDALAHFKTWCEKNGRPGVNITPTAFGLRLSRAGIPKAKRGTVFYGIRDSGLSDM